MVRSMKVVRFDDGVDNSLVSDLGKITQKMFTRGIVGTYRLRKQIVHSLDAQEEIEHVFRRVCQYVMTFILLLAFLLILGVNPNTIIMTGASCLTAAGIVLSEHCLYVC